MRHILVAYDLSPLSDRAVERAFQLAGTTHTKLTLLYVADKNAQEHSRDKAYTQIESMARELAQKTGAQAQLRIENGDAVEHIRSLAADENADLIVLGLHGQESIAGWFTGSTAERLIREGEAPVLIVQDKPVAPYRKVLAAVDFSPCSRRALEAALGMVPDAEISAAHMYDSPFPAMIGLSEKQEKDIREDALLDARREAADRMADFLAPFGGHIAEVLEQGEVTSALEGLIRRTEPDLLTMGTHGRSGFMAALLGSVALPFMKHPPCDILVAKGK